jgi:hypothetical protein
MKRLLLILLLALMCGLAYWYGTSQMEKMQKVGVERGSNPEKISP